MRHRCNTARLALAGSLLLLGGAVPTPAQDAGRFSGIPSAGRATLQERGAPPSRDSGRHIPNVVLGRGRCQEPLLWIGDRQVFSVFVNVARGTQLRGLALMLDYPHSGETPYRKPANRLTAEQLNGRSPVEWVIPMQIAGVYTAYFLAEGVGSPEPVREPGVGSLIFTVRNKWVFIGIMVVGVFLAWVVAKWGLAPHLLVPWARRQDRVPFASFLGFVALAWLAVAWTSVFFTVTPPIMLAVTAGGLLLMMIWAKT